MLHYDDYENLLCQIRGTKELIIFPPKDLKNLYYVGRRKGKLKYEFPGKWRRCGGFGFGFGFFFFFFFLVVVGVLVWVFGWLRFVSFHFVSFWLVLDGFVLFCFGLVCFRFGWFGLVWFWFCFGFGSFIVWFVWGWFRLDSRQA